jgi:rubrerythrin
MTQWQSVDEVLDFAIEREQESADFYTDLAGKMERKYMREAFESFAREELAHKARVQAIKDGKLLASSSKTVTDLKIGDYLVAEEPTTDMQYQDALILAMKKEKAAFRLYNDLAAATDDAGLRDTFLGLAQEEAKHKLRFEVEYDDHFLTEN